MSETASWQPSAPIANLLKRAAILAEIRRFFADRGVLEVETPTMSQATVTDVQLFPFQTRFVGPGAAAGMTLYMMTSPEYHMKRLLAAGSGPIYQLGRSFRNEEAGRYHNPEFTMLEWYRPHYDMYRLMNEVDDLLQQVLDCDSAETLSYQQAFLRHLDVDPLSADKAQLREVAAKLDLSNIADTEEDRDTLLQLLFVMGVEPHIGREKPAFVYHFPATQASLAEISTEDHRVAERFEVYFKGIELANGFRELTDSSEQRKRFEQDNRKRAALGLPEHPIDNYLLDALKHGMPECSGVALGVDRLVMLALGAESLEEVIAFPVMRA
ncbi:lysyl-tRNA synthetase class 2 [Gibbsiella quercinecans]|uniref:Elongation factor P--(R)-beta-lysine ligase n=1 Tax=Gibbsiella quercinecans TaxID=929813 RepID=A0A250B2F1_9GAMM|nr:elongation factor P--(R)-beta-lysine ligase [Gibbsiella quercinecans]ATA20246.1 poxB regulator PoxA [Gibbsiella quercinecans]RLM02933.1 elongation factor P lysine(34) lysyltransferase [Gibbsiella quercinecans]RLM05477.1 elongation factor P lysine(34) lysyltransferase [Gibbsiella quercinecans]RLM12378.1 elongation factor P lysine(34) lysyltransferase [Gibbsiella quercinecans]TCT88353.1 lysyl-tRNA synthetase class 2 [Gibbsiella quercinecans]